MKKEIRQDKIIRQRQGITTILYPEQTKQQVVREIENGELSIAEAMEMYEIRHRDTVLGWLRRYSKRPTSDFMIRIQKRYPEYIKKQVAYEVKSRQLTRAGACKKYGVSLCAIHFWLKLYSCEKENTNNSQEMIAIEKGTVNNSSHQQEINELRMKIVALEAMIDIAEKEFKIDVRKKPGTKQ